MLKCAINFGKIPVLVFFVPLVLSACQGVGQSDVVVEDQAVTERIEIAQELIFNGRLDQGLKILEKTSALETSNPAPDLAMAQIHYDLGNYERAEGHYRVALRKKASFDAQFGLARSLLPQRKTEEAIKYLESARAQKNSRGATLAYGVALDSMQRHSEAQLVYEKLIAANSGDLEAQNNLALSRALSGDLSGASRSLRQLADDYPNYDAFRHNLALVYIMQGNTKLAWGVVKGDLTRKEFNRNVDVIRKTYRS